MQERTQATPEETQNQYQPGDLVFFRRDTTKPLPTKLSGGYTGPWEVIKQHRNVVFCRHLAVGVEKPLHVSRLKLHIGSKESAREVAMRDKDQYLVKAITAWKGDPNKRSRMKFWVQYDDGDEMWVSYKADLVDNEHYREFIARDPRLIQHSRYPGGDGEGRRGSVVARATRCIGYKGTIGSTGYRRPILPYGPVPQYSGQLGYAYGQGPRCRAVVYREIWYLASKAP